MRIRRNVARTLLGPLAFALLPVGGCSDGSATGPGTVVIELEHTVDGAPLELNTGQYVNAAGNPYTVSVLEYVLSDFHFHPSASSASPGEHYEAPVAHYASQADASTRSIVLDQVSPGDYAEVHFVCGIVGSKNVSDAYPDLDLAGMAWPEPMGGGYHYLRNEGNYVDQNQQARAFTTHLGPSMGTDFSTEPSFDYGFTVKSGETTTIRLVMDVNEWYANPNTYDFGDHGAIMGDPAAQQILQANGVTVWSIGP